MRTPQEALRDAQPSIRAAVDGKDLEYRRIDEPEVWCLACQPTLWKLKDFANPSLLWRIKPEPKRTLRPWKPEEVPVGAVMRGRTINGMDRVLISAVSSGEQEARIWFLCPDQMGWNGAAMCAETCEHSTDGGKTWHPCGVWEEEA